MIVDVPAEVVANTHLSSDYNVVTLKAPAIAAAARPGQFVMVRTHNGLEPLLRRPFSLFEIVRDSGGVPTGFSLLSRRVGVGTAHVFSARPGDRFDCLGPLGRPFEPVDPPAEAWMVAGGVGLAPFATLAEALRARATNTTLFYGARRESELFCRETFTALGVRLVTATEDGSVGARGFVTVPLRDALAARPASAPLQLYACGPTPMMCAVAELAAAHDRPCAVSLEQVMGCGMGGCYSCVVRVRDAAGGAHFVRSCVAGPVFDGSSVLWQELVH